MMTWCYTKLQHHISASLMVRTVRALAPCPLESIVIRDGSHASLSADEKAGEEMHRECKRLQMAMLDIRADDPDDIRHGGDRGRISPVEARR